MSYINENECAAAGLDPKKIASIARRLERAAVEAQELGITIFGGSGGGSLRIHVEGLEERPLILAEMDGHFDGGDGACREDAHGLIRGE